MKKKLIITISAILMLATLATFALISGAEDVEPWLSIKYCNLSLEGTVHIWYAVDSNLEDESNVKLLIWTEPQKNGYTKGTENYVLEPQKDKEEINGEEYTAFAFDKLAAKQMTDVVYARAYVEVNGKGYYSPLNKYSILQYAYSKLGKLNGSGTSDEKLKTALTKMLEYGAATQELFDYKTDRLATADWHFITVSGGVLDDGAKHGLYLEGKTITLTANETDSGDFICWKNSSGVAVSNEKQFSIKVKDENESYTAFYHLSTSETGLIFARGSDGNYYVSGIKEDADPNVVIPSKYEGKPVTAIGESAFKDRTDITDVMIPDSVVSIGKDAFSGCTGLKNLIIGDGVTTVGESAFTNTKALASIFVGDSMTSLDCFEFYGVKGLSAPNLKRIVIGSGITNIGDYAFDWCRNLESVIIPESVTSIGKEAFFTCYNIESIVMPKSVTSIGDDAFGGCSMLSIVNIPENVTSIGKGAFISCAFTSIVIPNGVTIIDEYAFRACNNLTSVVILDGVTKICEGAFCDCESLTSVVIPASLTSIGIDAFDDCSNLDKVYFIGTESEKNITFDVNNDSIEAATWYYYSETQPTESGNFWHYVDGVPTVWTVG